MWNLYSLVTAVADLLAGLRAVTEKSVVVMITIEKAERLSKALRKRIMKANHVQRI